MDKILSLILPRRQNATSIRAWMNGVLGGMSFRLCKAEKRKVSRLLNLGASLALLLSAEISAAAEELADIRPPMELPVNYKVLVVIAIAIVILALILWLKKFIKFAKKVMEKPKIVKTPFEIAYELLNELKLRHLPENDKVKEYFFELSIIIRHFIEDYYFVKAPEMTTPEFLEYVKKNNFLSHEHKDILRRFLESCDMVKFAKYGPSSKEIDDSFVLAKKFIADVKAIDDEKKRIAEEAKAKK